jgi:serine/threonine protein kinase
LSTIGFIDPEQAVDAPNNHPTTPNLVVWQAREAALDNKIKDLVISPRDLTRVQLIGKGGYGSVYKGAWKGCAEAVAIKYVELVGVVTPRDRMDIKREAYIHKHAHNHPNICKLRAIVPPSSAAAAMPQLDQAAFALVMELLHGDLGQYLRSLAGEMLSMQERLQLAVDIADGMAHLHSKNIIHGDLKPGNLLIRKVEGGERVQVVVSDFGLSSISCVSLSSATIAAGQGLQSSSMGMSLWYSPPEVLRNRADKKTTAGDVYAFGIVMYEIFSGLQPYLTPQYDAVLKNVLEGRRPVLPAGVQVPHGCEQLMSSCWDADPAVRPSFQSMKRELRAVLADLPTV